MARMIKTFRKKMDSLGLNGYSHRDHRSKKGRDKAPFWDNGRIVKFKEEELQFGKLRYMKKRKNIKFR